MPRRSTARARLVDSAARLMHASTYAATNVEDLCASAGVQRGSFYYFFPSKRHLALAAVNESWARAEAGILGPAFASDVPPLERIVRFFHLAAKHQRGPLVLGCPFGNLAVEVSTQDVVIRDRVREVLDNYRAYFEAALREAADSGSADIPDPSAAAHAVLAYFQGAMLLAKTCNDAQLIVELSKRVVGLVSAPPDRIVGGARL
jgi:TetR/AcrR family transcriptional repressor of nem operon